MGKIEKWLKEKGYKVYELKETESGFILFCAIKKSNLLFICFCPDQNEEAKEDFLRSINNCGTPAGFCADSFKAFEKRMKELKLWVY